MAASSGRGGGGEPGRAAVVHGDMRPSASALPTSPKTCARQRALGCSGLWEDTRLSKTWGSLMGCEAGVLLPRVSWTSVRAQVVRQISAPLVPPSGHALPSCPFPSCPFPLSLAFGLEPVQRLRVLLAECCWRGSGLLAAASTRRTSPCAPRARAGPGEASARVTRLTGVLGVELSAQGWACQVPWLVPTAETKEPVCGWEKPVLQV